MVSVKDNVTLSGPQQDCSYQHPPSQSSKKCNDDLWDAYPFAKQLDSMILKGVFQPK